jgi:hypothetical protein
LGFFSDLLKPFKELLPGKWLGKFQPSGQFGLRVLGKGVGVRFGVHIL